jgi:hypothetical protein
VPGLARPDKRLRRVRIESCQLGISHVKRLGTAVTPFTPLRTAAKCGHEESVSYVAKNQPPGRISLLFTNRG